MTFRKLLACLLALASVATSRPALATAPAETAATERQLPKFADVRVDPGVDDAEYARSWCAIGINRGISGRAFDAEKLGSRRVAVELSGSVGAYHIDVGLTESGEWAGEVLKRDCRCSDAELITAISELVEGITTRVNAEAQGSTGSDSTPAARVPPESMPTDRTARAPLRRRGYAGLGLTLGGVGVAAMGVAFLVEGRVRSSATSDERDVGTNFTTPGIIAVVGGVAVLVAGITLLAVDRRQAKRRRTTSRGSWAPTFSAASFGGRF
jgi:hypothetical protein